MTSSPKRGAFAVVLATLLCGSLFALAAGRPPREDEERKRPPRERSAMPAVYDFSADCVQAEMLGATPGGAQDVRFFRDRVAAGEIPHPNVFTPEGLFSEHDLPLAQTRPCTSLLCISGQATPAALLAQPDVRFLAQVGFASGLDPKTWRRDALNLIAVVDKSGSMSGSPLETVKASLHHVADRMHPDDQLAIVLYGDQVHAVLAPTPLSQRDRIHATIDTIQSAGSTNMEAGLKLGFDLAHETRPSFKGTTRVMLFTDERPNVGATEAGSFMALAREASQAGVGLTTVGVGVQFGAELATAISSVRGGNLFFFPDVARMKAVFDEEFDTLVTELAYDMTLTFQAAPGFKIAGVYGIPGQALKWTEAGNLEVHVETLFLSKKKGAIYLALAPAGNAALPAREVAPGQAVAEVRLRYRDRSGEALSDSLAFPLAAAGELSAGLRRGLMLVNQVTALKEATRLHHEENKQEPAYQLVHALASLYRQVDDAELASERELVEKLEHTLARLSGHQGEPPRAGLEARPDAVTGLPPRR